MAGRRRPRRRPPEPSALTVGRHSGPLAQPRFPSLEPVSVAEMCALGYALAICSWAPTLWLALRSGYVSWPIWPRRFDEHVRRSVRLQRDAIEAILVGVAGTAAGLAIVAFGPC